MLQCEVYARLDHAHGGALSVLSEPELADGLLAEDPASGSDGEPPPASPAAPHAADASAAAALHLTPTAAVSPAAAEEAAIDQVPGTSDHAEDDYLVDADPRDEVMTAYGPDMVLLFGLFVDGVQLHVHGRSTTTVFCLKCLDLPGFLANTDLASYTLAFIEGPKEPTCMTTVLMTILKQFKIFEPTGIEHEDGTWHVHCIT